MTHNDQGLQQCWDFITVSRQQEPIEKLVMKLPTNAQLKIVCPILADSCTNADCSSVRQHSSKPHVACCRIHFVVSNL